MPSQNKRGRPPPKKTRAPKKQEPTAEGSFAALDLHDKVKGGVRKAGFVTMTPIQRATIPLLVGDAPGARTLLGVSRTGSGKSLCFIVPLLDRLFRLDWQRLDGLGALIVLPTRELCIQTFTVLNTIGKNFDLSCGLITGGHSVDAERKWLETMNIIVATPGRLLHHLSETPGFSGDSIKVLVFDEVDMTFECGFLRDVIELMGYFPHGDEERLTLFFTATATKATLALIRKVLDAGGIPADSLRFVSPDAPGVSAPPAAAHASAHEPAAAGLPGGRDQDPVIATADAGTAADTNTAACAAVAAAPGPSERLSLPENLVNVVMPVHEADKVDVLFSFIRSHTEHKTVVFFATCREVSFVYEAFRRLRPGVSLMHLSRKMKQGRRQDVFDAFVKAKAAVLLATDLASRGLDVPLVHWVVHFDCPEDARAYCHRAGRAARMNRAGVSVLLLTPHEERFKARLADAGVSFSVKNIRLKKAMSVRQSLAMLCVKESYIRYLAEKALVAYLKSLTVMGDKQVFGGIAGLNIPLVAQGYGLTSMPVLLKRTALRAQAGAGGSAGGSGAGDRPDGTSDSKDARPETRFEHLRARTNQQVLAYARKEGLVDESGQLIGGDDDILRVVARYEGTLSPEEAAEVKRLVQDRALRRAAGGSIEAAAQYADASGKHRRLDDSDSNSGTEEDSSTSEQSEERVARLRSLLSKTDQADRRNYKSIIRKMHGAGSADSADDEEDNDGDEGGDGVTGTSDGLSADSVGSFSYDESDESSCGSRKLKT